MKTTVKLKLVKETRGALLYALDDRQGHALSNVYLRKDAVPRLASGGWPAEAVVTVEVPAEVPQ